jgi:hypothetical protein
MNQAINEIIQLSRLLQYLTKTTQEKQNLNCVEKDRCFSQDEKPNYHIFLKQKVALLHLFFSYLNDQ